MTTAGDEAIFLDTNVLVYANVAESPLHEAARRAVETRYNAGMELWVSRQVLREFVVILTCPQAFANPRPVATVIERVRFFQSRFRVADDGQGVTEKLLALLEQVPVGGRQVHDANIVATMQVYGIQHLLTHNVADFRRFSQFIITVPIETPP